MSRITLRDYEQRQTGVQRYISYCVANGWQPYDPEHPGDFSANLEWWLHDLLEDGLAFETIRHYMHAARWTILRAYDAPDPVLRHVWDAAITTAKHEAEHASRATVPFSLEALTRQYDTLLPTDYFNTLFAMMFLLRSCEYCAPGGSPATAAGRRPIRHEHVSVVANSDGTEDLHIVIPRSKTDPTGRGSRHARRATGELRTCLVHNYRRMMAALPAESRAGHLCRAPDGKPLKAQRVNLLLKRLHVAAGLSPDLVTSHSLRKAGAERIWLATRDVLLVMREGRWQDEATMRRYVALDTAATAAVSGGMVAARTHDGRR